MTIIGTSNTTKFKEDMDVKFSNEADYSNDEVAVAPLDFGLSFGLAYKLENNIKISAGYSLGLTNLSPKEVKDYDEYKPEDQKYTNGVISLSVAYMFEL